MMKSNKNTKAVFGEAAESTGKPQLRLVREEKAALPRYVALSKEDYRLWQYKQQCLQLAENLKNAAAAHTPENMAKQNQRPRFSSAAEEQTVAKQAAIQENGGSIFSTAYSRFNFR